ncbi:nucleoside phosphorylase [Algoriphagus sp.]|uniref:nucleoside phosphorylase n=1 Tax=Algoriphagus sp. TaxID=1872435 RepID=UPI0025DB0D28|nr:nucleoside phosphorylase [Algoriphagus sp.]
MRQVIPESELILNADGSVYHLHLKPENLASLVFTVGDPDRVQLVSQYFDEIEFKTQKREFVTHTGRIGDTRVTVMSTGMGTDNIEILMTELDALVNINLESRQVNPTPKSLQIIRLGTSGAMQSDIPVGSLLASTKAIGLDTLMQFYPNLSNSQDWGNSIKKELNLDFYPYQTEASQKLLNKLDSSFLKGITLTCPGFYAPQGRAVRVKPKIDNMLEKLSSLEISREKLTNFEMETAGYYALGALLGHEVLSLNAIIANRNKSEFDKEPEKTVDLLIRTALKLFIKK